MGAPASLHPTDQTLQAYGLGRLDADASASVDSHLSECSDCRRRASEISGDSFLGRLREANDATGSRGAPPPKGRGPSGPPDEAMPRELAEHPDYEVVRELGRGGMGVVYLAENTLMGRMEVLKVVGSHLVRRQGVLDRFLREIRSAAKLHHPNIVAAYAAMRLGEIVVLAMEYVEGEDLSKLVKSRGPLPVTNACYFAYQAALGLQHAHERGMVHRDIKPANLMLAREGKRAIVKVLDFGLAKATSEGQFDAGLTHEGQMLGTPDYIAPEQIVDAQKADIRADVYSLGCTLYYLLSGGPPFRGSSLYDLLQAHHSIDAPALNLTRPEVPAELAALVAKMMAKGPAQRFQTPGEVAQALTRFLKPGAQPSLGSSAELARAVPAAEPTAPAARPATGLGAPASAQGAPKSGPEGVAWSSLIEFKETAPSLLASKPKPPEPEAEPAGAGEKPPRNWWPAIAGASAVGSLVLGIVITITTNKGTTRLDVPGDRAIKATVDNVGVTYTPAAPAKPEAEAKDSTAPDLRGASPGPARDVVAGPAPEAQGGAWKIEGDELVQSTLARGATLLFGDPSWSSYDFKFRAKSTGGTHGFKAKFHATGRGNLCEFALGNYFNKYHDLSYESAGRWGRASDMLKPGRIDPLRWYDVRLEIRGPEYRCFLDNALLFQGRSDRFTSGRVGLATWDNTARFRDIEVVSPDGKALWRGLPVPPAGPSSAAVGPAGATDHFRAGSIWMGSRSYRRGLYAGSTVSYELYVTERDGARFLGHVFDNGHGRNRAQVEGEVDGTAISWRERSVYDKNALIKMSGNLSGNILSLKFEGNYGAGQWNQGDGELSWTGGGAGPAETAGGPGDYAPLFNGKDLAGWIAYSEQGVQGVGAPGKDDIGGIWSVRDGTVRGSGGFSHLFSPRGDYENFRVRAEIKINDDGDSGLFLRATTGPGFPRGYEIQINSTSVGSRTGSLIYAPGRVIRIDPSPAPVGRWFVLEAEAVGDRIRVRIDGTQCIDWRDDQKLNTRGHFAIQVHGPPSQVQVRGLEVMELDAPGRPLPATPGAAVVERHGAEKPARAEPPANPAARPALDIRRVPIRPGALTIAAAPPDAFWPNLTPNDTEGWRVGDPGLVRMDARGLVVEAGAGGNFLLTRRSDYKKCSLSVELSAGDGAEAFLVLRAEEGPGGWRGVTSRIVDEGGKVRAGLQALDFAAAERAGDPKVGNAGAEFAPRANFRVKFSIDEKAKATVLARGKAVVVAHDGPRPDAGAVGLFVRKGSVTVRSLRVEE